jgi:hypothetical protein
MNKVAKMTPPYGRPSTMQNAITITIKCNIGMVLDAIQIFVIKEEGGGTATREG